MDTEQKLTTEQIWRELHQGLRRFLRSRLPTDADADDVLQMVFLQIHQKVSRLRQNEKLHSWVFQIARNAVVDFYRRRKNSESQNGREPETLISDQGNEPFAHVIGGCILRMMKQLPPEQRDSIRWFEQQGISQQEVADRMSISLTAAKSRIQRARKNLQQMLKNCCQMEFDRRGVPIGFAETSSCGCSENQTCCECS